MKRKIFGLCAALAALGLELLPYGAVCMFANPEGEPWRRTFSYFDLTPFGYANFAPFLTALLTCALVILSAGALILKKPLRRATAMTAAAAALLSLVPLLLFGTAYFSLTGALITAALAATAAISIVK